MESLGTPLDLEVVDQFEALKPGLKALELIKNEMQIQQNERANTTPHAAPRASKVEPAIANYRHRRHLPTPQEVHGLLQPGRVSFGRKSSLFLVSRCMRMHVCICVRRVVVFLFLFLFLSRRCSSLLHLSLVVHGATLRYYGGDFCSSVSHGSI